MEFPVDRTYGPLLESRRLSCSFAASPRFESLCLNCANTIWSWTLFCQTENFNTQFETWTCDKNLCKPFFRDYECSTWKAPHVRLQSTVASFSQPAAFQRETAGGAFLGQAVHVLTPGRMQYRWVASEKFMFQSGNYQLQPIPLFHKNSSSWLNWFPNACQEGNLARETGTVRKYPSRVSVKQCLWTLNILHIDPIAF